MAGYRRSRKALGGKVVQAAVRTDVTSRFLGPNRHVEIWLPPGYDSGTTTRYPVLLVSDG